MCVLGDIDVRDYCVSELCKWQEEYEPAVLAAFLVMAHLFLSKSVLWDHGPKG